MSRQFTLKKHQRLKSRKLIQQLFESGKSFRELPFRIVYGPGRESTLQLGVSVSKRRFRKAVDRNRIRRLMREAWRLNAVPLQQLLEEHALHLAVFIVFNGSDIPTFHEVDVKMKLILQKLMKRSAEVNQRH